MIANPYYEVDRGTGHEYIVTLSNGAKVSGVWTKSPPHSAEAGFWTMEVNDDGDWLDIAPHHIVSIESKSKVMTG